MTKEEAIANLRTIKEYFEEESGATPICLEYAIEALKADVARWSSWNKTFEQSGIADLISRADAIEAVRKEYEDAINIGDNGDAIAYDVERILSALPSANYITEKPNDAIKPSNDVISRADALMELNGACSNWKDDAKVAEIINALPSADRPTVIRSRTLMPTKDFKEWAKRIKEENPNVIVIPCDAEVASADRPQGEWIQLEQQCEYRCSNCGKIVFADDENELYYCCSCGARMENKDE